MKTEEITVGHYYRHAENPDNLYLGVGMRRLWTTKEFVSKHLVIVESDDPSLIGMLVQEGKNVIPGYWDMFFPEEDGVLCFSSKLNARAILALLST